MKVNKLITPHNKADGIAQRIKYIVIHYVGADGDAEANCRYYASKYIGASAHYFVGFHGDVWQSVEDKDVAWHCGAKSYKHLECRNSNSIGIELCVKNKGNKSDDSRDWYFEKATVQAAAELTKELMQKYRVPAENILRHYDVTGKICPNPFVYNHTQFTWTTFKDSLQSQATEDEGFILAADKCNYTITVVGIGYVGLSLSVLLSQKNRVYAVDTNIQKINAVNNRISPVKDSGIDDYLKNKELDLVATTDAYAAYCQSDFIVVSVPTDYNMEWNRFDTTILDLVLFQASQANPNALIIIKSTIPIGYTESIRKEIHNPNIIFSPEFLREGSALYDNLYPSRIVIGTDVKSASLVQASKRFASLLKESSLQPTTPVLLVGFNEAEAIKLFSNTCLALRISFFNELDTLAGVKGMNSQDIIKGVCLDPRIGGYYNNPSFGYGGYCLPKDTRQLAAQFEYVPGTLIKAISISNDTRKNYIADRILKIAGYDDQRKFWKPLSKPTIGIYRLSMKSDSDNMRQSSVLDIIELLKKVGAEIIIFEPLMEDNSYSGCMVCRDIEVFKQQCGLIAANRMDERLNDVIHKVFTRDLYQRE